MKASLSKLDTKAEIPFQGFKASLWIPFQGLFCQRSWQNNSFSRIQSFALNSFIGSLALIPIQVLEGIKGLKAKLSKLDPKAKLSNQSEALKSWFVGEANDTSQVSIPKDWGKVLNRPGNWVFDVTTWSFPQFFSVDWVFALDSKASLSHQRIEALLWRLVMEAELLNQAFSALPKFFRILIDFCSDFFYLHILKIFLFKEKSKWSFSNYKFHFRFSLKFFWGLISVLFKR